MVSKIITYELKNSENAHLKESVQIDDEKDKLTRVEGPMATMHGGCLVNNIRGCMGNSLLT